MEKTTFLLKHFFFIGVGILFYFLISIDSLEALEAKERGEERSDFVERRGEDFFKREYLEGNLESFLENRVDFVTVQIETTGGFSLNEPYVFSMSGGSYLWNAFFYEGFNISDIFLSGSSLYKVSLFNRGVELNRSKSHIEFSSKDFGGKSEWWVGGRLSPLGPLGERFFLADEWTRELGGYASPYEREGNQLEDKASERNRVVGSVSLGVRVVEEEEEEERGEEGRIFEVEYFEMRRDLGEVNFKGRERRYGNENRRFEGLFETRWREGEDEWGMGHLFSYYEDSHFGFYLGLDERQSQYLTSGSWSSFIKHKREEWQVTSGVNVTYKRFEGREVDFSYNVFDLGGEGIEPFLPSYVGLGVSVPVSLEVVLGEGTRMVLASKDDFIFTEPLIKKRKTQTHGVYFENETERFSLYAQKEEVGETVGWVMNRSLNVKGFRDWFDNGVLVSAGEIGLDQSGFVILGEERLFFINFSFELKNTFNVKELFKVEWLMGKKNIGLDSKTMLFFSDLFSSSRRHYWDDQNDNQVVEEREVNQEVFDTTGGEWHHLSGDLLQPYLLYVSVPVRLKINKIGFTWESEFRSFRDLFWVNYRDGLEKNGFFETDSQGKEWFFLKEGEKHYEVGNFNLNEGLPKQKVSDQQWKRGHYFLEHPFYLSMKFGIDYEKKDLKVGMSFTAFLVMMLNTRGNGVSHQSLGTLSELTASPNGYVLSSGRGDADRGYFMKMYYYQKFNSRLSSSWTLKYRDGQPFGTYETKLKQITSKKQQVSFQKSSVHGDNIFSGKSGRREDSHWDLSGRLKATFFSDKKKTLSLLVRVENLLDIGSEILEDTLREVGKKNRVAVPLSVEIPRSLFIGLEGSF